MKKRISGKTALSIVLIVMMIFSMFLAINILAYAATEADIEQAIEDGLAWLVAQQNSNAADPNYGSWIGYYDREAGTGLALYKLCDRAYELKKENPDIESPFDPDYEYHQNVSNGFDWVFDHLVVVDIGLQDHTTGATGTVDDPDTRVNGKGVCTRHGTTRETYDTGILLAAIAASGTFNRVVNVPTSPVNGWTYGQVAQDMVDFLAFSQVDPVTSPYSGAIHEGGWDYIAVNNGTGGTWWKGDQSNSGYAVLGLGEAEAFGCTIPDWVKTELNWWIDWVQDDFNGDTNDGGSWYSYPGDGIGVNILKTGNLIFEMKLVGDNATTQRVTNATDYLATHWNDASGINQPAGWNGTPAQYQAMFCAMKGLEYMGIDTFDGIDWFEDFSDVIVAQQDKTPGPTYGSWQSSSGRGEPVIITEWALLTLEKVVPLGRSITKKVYVELLKNGDFSSGLDCWKVRVENWMSAQTYDGPDWLAIRPLGPGWTDVNLINEPGRTNVLDIIQTVSDLDGDWTGVYQTINREVSSFSELYFEAYGKAMFQSLGGDGWVGGEYPVHFIIQYEDVNGIQHDRWVCPPSTPAPTPPPAAWQQGFYYLFPGSGAGLDWDGLNPYSNKVTQNVWFHYKSPNLMNLSPAPATIKTVRLYSSGWAYHGRIDNAQLYGTPPSAELGDVIHVELEVGVPFGETATVVDTLPTECAYIDGTFTVNGVPATPTITKTPTKPKSTIISYTITEPGLHTIEFDCKVDSAYWEEREVCNVVTATWYDEAGEVIETKEDVECFIIHAFEELQKNAGVPKKVKVIPAPVQFWREFIGGVTDIIVFDPPEIIEPVALVREYLVLHAGEEPIPLEHLTWENMDAYPWEPIDTPGEPYILPPDEVVEYDIPTVESDTAVLVRYTVAWASTPDVIETHFINEAILESKSPQVIVGQLSNFDVHNDYDEPVDNFELELYGVDPSDIVDWFPGWGTPPEINPIPPSPDGTMPGGTEIIWKDTTQPVQPCEWVHFGLYLKPGVIAVGIKAYWTQTAMAELTIKEKTEVKWAFEIEVTNPFCYTMKNVTIKDNFGAELEIDEIKDPRGDANYDGTVNVLDLCLTARSAGTDPRWPHGTGWDEWNAACDFNGDNKVDVFDLFVAGTRYGLTLWLTGRSEKVHLFWYIGDLEPGETARINLVVSTDLNPAGHQEYTEPGVYEMNSGATLKFIDPLQDTQLSAVTDSIYVTVLEDP